MTHKASKNLLKTTGALLLSSAFALSASALTGEGDPVQHEQQQGAQNAQQIEQQFAQAQAELQQISEALAPAQQEAQAQPEVQSSLLEYDAALVETMKEIAPDNSEAIEQRGELFRELVQAGDPAEFSEEQRTAFETAAQQFQEVRNQLGELEVQAQQGEEVQAKLMEYQEVFMAAVVEIEPRAEELIQRQADLQRSMMEMRQQVTQ